MAEAKAVLFAVEEAAKIGWRKVKFESDSLSIISKLHKGGAGLNELGVVMEDILWEARVFDEVVRSNVCRGGNGFAHLMARLSPFILGTRLWTNVFPDVLSDVVISDVISNVT